MKKRAVLTETTDLRERAAQPESPAPAERAVTRKSPTVRERARSIESPALPERAIRDESPVSAERSFSEIRERLRILVRDHANYKRWDVRYQNALKLKRGDEEQKRPTPYVLTPQYKERMEGLKVQSDAWTDEIVKEIASLVHQLPIWREWAKEIKPLGEITIAYLEAFVDLWRALDGLGHVTISKVWRFCGYGPAEDKGAPGKRKYVESVKTQLYQWGLSLEKQGAICESKYHAIYIGAKHRHENSDAEVGERKKNQPPAMVAWKDARAGHRRNDAIRHAVKEMLKDYVIARAALEGLTVRPPYAEEYLGRRHSA